MRAARTPPDPAPMTKKSTSKAMAHALRRDPLRAFGNLEIDALLLHLLTGARKDVGRQLLGARIGNGAELLEEYRLGCKIFLADLDCRRRRRPPRSPFPTSASEQRRRLREGLLRALIELGLNGPRRVSRRLSLISGRVLVTLRSSSVIMPGTTSAIVCLTPISPRIAVRGGDRRPATARRRAAARRPAGLQQRRRRPPGE